MGGVLCVRSSSSLLAWRRKTEMWSRSVMFQRAWRGNGAAVQGCVGAMRTRGVRVPAARAVSGIVLEHPPVAPVREAKAPARQASLLSEEEKEEMKKLRAEDASAWTVSSLAAKFGCSPAAVGQTAPLSAAVRKKKEMDEILRAKPSKNWKGRTHYRRVKEVQREYLRAAATEAAQL